MAAHELWKGKEVALKRINPPPWKKIMIGRFLVVVGGGDTGRNRRMKVALVVLSGMSLDRASWESVVSSGVACMVGTWLSRVDHLPPLVAWLIVTKELIIDEFFDIVVQDLCFFWIEDLDTMVCFFIKLSSHVHTT
ncbi:hypothetical protein LXL04_026802 [Taraxacum kok-saghyz]